jgi:hypothetical protein
LSEFMPRSCHHPSFADSRRCTSCPRRKGVWPPRGGGNLHVERARGSRSEGNAGAAEGS